ncbi:hypothetical protein Scep_024852 [Stephania cephalantha]|uniref:Uncharacterized protein n=1 Tax=Stephania cephalantha TaxID=152367 RepID=A0AAP0F078_9MAGN
MDPKMAEEWVEVVQRRRRGDGSFSGDSEYRTARQELQPIRECNKQRVFRVEKKEFFISFPNHGGVLIQERSQGRIFTLTFDGRELGRQDIQVGPSTREHTRGAIAEVTCPLYVVEYESSHGRSPFGWARNVCYKPIKEIGEKVGLKEGRAINICVFNSNRLGDPFRPPRNTLSAPSVEHSAIRAGERVALGLSALGFIDSEANITEPTSSSPLEVLYLHEVPPTQFFPREDSFLGSEKDLESKVLAENSIQIREIPKNTTYQGQTSSASDEVQELACKFLTG